MASYPYADRQVRYRSERLEISQEEWKRIKSIAPTPVTPHPSDLVTGRVNVLIDTDIGTDADDALALLYALRLPQLNIVGITTNYGPTDIRALDARTIVAGHRAVHPTYPDIPVVEGASRQLGTHRPIFIYGNEGLPFLGTEELVRRTRVDVLEARPQRAAAAFIAYAALQYPDLVIISIGIPTNIALAIQAFPEIVPRIKNIVMMGCGSFVTKQHPTDILKQSYDRRKWDSPRPAPQPFNFPPDANAAAGWLSGGLPVHLMPNHNLSGDTLASKAVFESGIPIKIINHAVTSCFWLEGPGVQFLLDEARQAAQRPNAAPTTAGEAVGMLVNAWFRLRGQNGQCPHDPLTVHEAAFGGPDGHVLYVNGTLVLHEWAAFSTFIPHHDGRHQLGVAVQNRDEFLQRLTATYMQER